MTDFHLTAEQWQGFIDHSPEMVMILNGCGKIEYVNYTTRDYTREELIGSPIYSFVPSRFHETMSDCYQRVLATRKPDSYEVEYVSPDGSSYWYSTRVGPLQMANQEAGLVLCVHDVTEIKKARNELARQKSILTAVIESMADGLAVVDEDGDFLVYNLAAERTVGIRPPEEPDGDWSSYFGLYRTDKTTLLPEDEIPLRRAAKGEKQRDVEVFIRNHAQPEGRYVSVNATPLTDNQGRHRGGVAVFRDITEARQARETLKSEQLLLLKLLDLQESDRKLVAHEIHDGLAQDIVGAQMHLESAMHRLVDDPEVSATLLEQASHLLQNAIAESRRMINGLRPLIIDEEGVVAALKHLIAEQETEAGLEIRFRYDDDIGRLDSRMEGNIYRIVQEALNNVKQHSGSSIALVELRHRKESLNLRVRDHGVGFDLADIPTERFGLRSIRERARLMGGSAMIESRPGEGTTIHVDFPEGSLV